MRTAPIWLLMVCAALGAEDTKEQARAKEALEEMGAKVRVDRPAGRKPYTVVIWRGGAATDKDLAHLKALPDLEELILDCPKVTDAGLAQLKGMAGLRELRLCGQAFTDKGLAHLKGLKGLRQLHVLTEELSDDGLASLKPLADLEKLVLATPKLTDAGLRQLKGMKKLKELDLGFRSKVTEAGVKELNKALPDLVVTR